MKNYTFLPLIILLLITFNSNCQNFAPVGATWHYNEYSYGPPPNDINYILVESIKDTIVLGKNAKKLDATMYWAGGGTSPWDTYIIHSDSNKVYLYRCNQFYLLYDFNANQGDTIHIVDPDCGWWNDTLIDVLIDSVKMENIGGFIKKVQYVTSIEGWSWNIGTKFIESIGSNRYLLPMNATLPEDIALRCYSDSFINYQLVPDCEELVVGVKEDVNQENKYTIPTVVYEHLQLPAIIGDLLIYDLQGKLIKNEKIKPIINLENMNKGIYILILKNDELFIKQKLIKF